MQSVEKYSSRPSRFGQFGFTAVELLVVVAILGVLATLAAPSFALLLEKMRVTGSAHAMESSFYLARSEAIKHGGGVLMVKTPVGTECTRATTKQDWSCGWSVVLDKDRNGRFDASSDTQIQVIPFFKGVDVSVSTSSAATDILRFDRWGQANGQGSMRVLFVPVASGVASHATTTLCINSGMRVDIRRGDVTC